MTRKDADKFLIEQGLIDDPARIDQITKARQRLTESLPLFRAMLKEVVTLLSASPRRPRIDQVVGSIHAMLNETEVAYLVSVLLSPVDLDPDDPSINELEIIGKYGLVIDAGISEFDTPYIDVMVGQLKSKNR